MSLTDDALARLPDALQRPLMVAVLQAAVEPLDQNDAVAQEIKEAFDLGSEPLGFALDLVGNLIGQPRLLNQPDDEYLRALLARIRVRQSRGTLPDIKAIAALLSSLYGDGSYSVVSPEAKTLTISIGSLTADASERATVVELLLDSIGEVDRLELLNVGATPFTWGVAGLGWGEGFWSEVVYSSF